jgi:YidC/Oxa1 family membrane protein insertase
MEKRALLAIALSILVFALWEVLFTPEKRPSPPGSPSTPSEQTPQTPARQPAPQPEPPPAPVTQPPRQTAPSFPAATARPGRDVVVETPLYRAVFTETGGRLKSFVLKQYRESLRENAPGKELVKNQEVDELPLAFNFLNHPAAALSLAPFVADKSSLSIEGEQGETLRFTYEASGWLRITRQYLFRPDDYVIDLAITVENLDNQPWEDAPTLSLINRPLSTMQARYNFQGPALLVNNKLEEIKYKKIKGEKVLSGHIDWVAYTNQYFTMALVPLDLVPSQARFKGLDDSLQMVQTTLVGPKKTIPPGGQEEFRFKLYAGPKEVKILKAAQLELEKVVNFGWFDVIAQPLLVCLKFFNRFTHNYGLAIIVLTVLIKVLFWPLTHKSYQSMQAMKKLQPKMAQIREKYRDEKEKMNQEILQLYRTHKVNPMGGCLPMVLQIPVFFALYRVLYSSIAMRHAPFLWWINDLSAPDRLNVGLQIPYLGGLPVLTLLMGVSMFVQQKMTPTSADPRQEKMMLMLPVVFTVFFVNFPSGLVLYWLVNNLLSIGQQYYINKKAAQA